MSSADTEFQVPRSVTSMGFNRPKFNLSPHVSSRSLSAVPCAGWQDAPYPHHHNGLTGAFLDFWLAVYHETPIIAPLLKKLVIYLGIGVKAYFMFFRLLLFAAAIAPVVAQAGVWWWNSDTISRGVRYGSKPRNFLDIYHVATDGYKKAFGEDEDAKYPVVVYVTGGAWIIGYKAWAVSLGEYLSSHGVMMVALDYRNFPQGTLKDMVEDVNTALDWVWENIQHFGGDRNRILIVGQSAGAQILSTILLSKASNAHKDFGMPLSAWKKFIGASGPYDIVSLAPIVNKRGLYLRMLKAIMDNDLFAASPTRVLSTIRPEAVSLLPPILLFHGTNDATVPYSSSVEFFDALKRAGKSENIHLELWRGVSHSEPLVEGPAAGNNFFGSRLVFEALGRPGSVNSEPLMHESMIRFAKFIMPF